MATEKQLRDNSEYWKKRFQLLEERNHDKADKLSEKLRKEYAKAEKEIEKLTYEWYGRIAANNEVSMDEARKLLKGAELSEFKWTVDQYIEVGSKENLSPEWIKQLENASARAHISRLDAQKVYLRNTVENLYGKEEQLVKSGLMETYEDNLYRTAFEIEKGCGVGVNFAKADTRRIEAVINRPWAQDAETFSDRIWDSKAALATELETQLMQNVMLGRSNEEAVKAIEKRFGVSYRQADRLIRTETAAIASQAQQEAFKELDVEKYEIVATLDNRTSEICQEMDGKVFDMKDYEVGTTAPPFHPNCRSCTVPYIDDDFGETIQRVARDENGEREMLSENLNYREWKTRFLRQMIESDYNRIDWPRKGIPLSIDEITQIKEYAKNKRIIIQGIKHFDGDREELKRTIDTLSELADIYPEVREGKHNLRLEFSSLFASNDFGATDQMVIVLNINPYRDIKLFESEVKKLAEIHYFTRGTTYHDIVVHEFGHVIANKYNINCIEIAEKILGEKNFLNRKELLDEIKRILSTYGGSRADGSEIISECFSSVYGSNPIPGDFELRFIEECDIIIKNKKEGVQKQ